jgi:hypothetical protein
VDAIVALIDGAGKIVFTGWEVAVKVCCLNAYQGTAASQRDPEVSQCVFRPGGARPPAEVIKAFVDKHRNRYGVEPICKALQFAPSAYRRHAARQRNPALISQRAQRDAELIP